MRGELVGLNERWAARLKWPIALGIGINTGEALVGNTGSVHRLKYGPLGNAVNLASRVEGVTKQLGVPLLLTRSTHDKLDGAFATRRLCQVRVVNIDAPVTLFELHGETAPPDWAAMRDAYEAALAQYEEGNFPLSCRTLFPLLDDPDMGRDQPSILLASRAIEGLKSNRRAFDPVMTLDSK
jgi:adenylate cyclase